MFELIAILALVLASGAFFIALRTRLEMVTIREVMFLDHGRSFAGKNDEIWDALRGVRVECVVSNDGDGFEELLRAQLLRFGGEIVLESGDIVGTGSLVSHGYPDVYFRADFEFLVGDEVVLTVRERRDEGDRQINLALEIAAGLARVMGARCERDARRELSDRL